MVALVVENPPASAGDVRDKGSIPRSGRSPGGHSNSLQYSCWENPMHRGAWHMHAYIYVRVCVCVCACEKNKDLACTDKLFL